MSCCAAAAFHSLIGNLEQSRPLLKRVNAWMSSMGELFRSFVN